MSGLAAVVVLAAGMKLVASHSAYPDGAPPGFSGGFREESCHACHFDRDPNAPGGQVSIDGIPDRYVAGRGYALTLTLSRAGMKLAGFQLTARFDDGGAQAGTLTPGPTDMERVAIGRDGPVQYAGQTKAGSTVNESGVATWSVEWTAPSSGGSVVFHVAANAADGNGSADGDFVYTSTAASASTAPEVSRPGRRR